MRTFLHYFYLEKTLEDDIGVKILFKLSVNKCCYTIFLNNASCKDKFNFKIQEQTIKYDKYPTCFALKNKYKILGTRVKEQI